MTNKAKDYGRLIGAVKMAELRLELALIRKDWQRVDEVYRLLQKIMKQIDN